MIETHLTSRNRPHLPSNFDILLRFQNFSVRFILIVDLN